MPVGTPLPYTIKFQNAPENIAAATPITQVRILQNINENLDVRSFRLGDIRLGDILVHMPSYRGAFVGDFDLIRQRGIILRVTAGVDVVSHIATWVLTAIDPLTGLQATDPSLGLLLPNTDLTQWGSATYTIKTMPGAANGAPIVTAARVFFGDDAPFDTPEAANTIDAVAPTTNYSVQDLGGGTYLVNWQGLDNAMGSGIADYTVYRSVGGGAYVPWLQHTNELQATYTDDSGYGATFVVRAADRAGNVEAAPEGVELPSYNPLVNFGVAPSETTLSATTTDAVPPAPTPSTNALFTRAKLLIPSHPSPTSPGQVPPDQARLLGIGKCKYFSRNRFLRHLLQQRAGRGSLTGRTAGPQPAPSKRRRRPPWTLD